MSTRSLSHRKIALQYFSIVVALVFVGQFPAHSGSFSDAGARMVNQMASVIGMSVGVPPNEANLLAQDLEQRSIELTEREKAIDAKERDIRTVVAEENAKHDKFILSIIIGVTLLLTTLIVLNFYLDRVRGAKSRNMQRETSTEGEHKPKTGTHAHEGEFSTKL